MKYLLITLGHGSSAIYIDDEKNTVIGYEQERLSGIKSDSQFPKDAINEIINNVGYSEMKGCYVYISHWFNHQYSSADMLYNKYMQKIDVMNLKELSCGNIVQVNKSFSHHDAHAYSALSFLCYNAPEYAEETYTIIADGFGNNEEVLSIYKSEAHDTLNPKLILRVSDYRASLGLMYQYATSFCGMKENQDEYKFLGYESHINEVLSLEMIDALDFYVEDNVKVLESFVHREMLKKPEDRTVTKECNIGIIVDTVALQNVKMRWHATFKELIDIMGIDKNDTFKVRCVVAYFIQQSIELFFVRLIKEFNMENVCLAGGCFYNVKLNNRILKNIPSKLCIMPLAGDQGAAIGMYTAFSGNVFNFGNLCFGKRRLYGIEKYKRDNIKVVSLKTPGIVHSIAKDICDGNIVNIVRENMEFGPRALCSTSSLFLPTTENVARNNLMNRRNEVMPCAPVILSENVQHMFNFKEFSRVIGSSKYMICTFNYTKPYSKQYGGVMHKKPLENVYTGRPQVIESEYYAGNENDFMLRLLTTIEYICDAKCLVNTSFNAHGRPIVFDTMDIIHNFNFQCEHSPRDKQPILYIIKD